MRISRFLFFITIISMSMILASSCGNGEEPASASIFGITNVMKQVPADAMAVGVVDMGQIMKKLDYNEFKKTQYFKSLIEEAKKEGSAQLEKLLDDPESSGIATNGKICMYIDARSSEDMDFNILFPIKNLQKVNAFMKAMAEEEEGLEGIKEENGISYMMDKNGQVGMAWNKKMLTLSTSSTMNAKKALTKVYADEKQENILSNKKFKMDVKSNHDLMFWMQSDKLADFIPDDYAGYSSLAFSEKDLKGNTFTWFQDFKKGEMVGGIKYDMNEDISKKYGKIFKDKVSTKFSKYFPGENLSNFTMIGLDLKGLQELLEEMSLTGLVNMRLAESGMKLEDITSGLNGDIAVGTYMNVEKSDNPDDFEPEVFALIAIPFDDPALLDKILALAKDNGTTIKREGNRLTPQGVGMDGGAVFVDNILLLSNNAAALDQLEKGGFSGKEAFAKAKFNEMSKGWMSMFFDFEGIQSNMTATADNDEFSRGGFGGMNMKMLKEFDELISSTTIITKEDATNTLKLKTDNVNSLKVLSQLAEKYYKMLEKMPEKPKEYAEEKEETTM